MGEPDRETFVGLLDAALDTEGSFGTVSTEDFKKGLSYIHLGGWLGDQGEALRLIGLGAHLGTWGAITPALLGLKGDLAEDAAGGGVVMPHGYFPEGMPTVGSLTVEQTFERAISLIAGLYQDFEIHEVERLGEPDDDGMIRFDLKTDAGNFAGFRLPAGMEPPAVGDAVRYYSPQGQPVGLGSNIVGGDLRGEPCWFTTLAEREAERRKWLADSEARKREAWEKEADHWKGLYDALPEDLRFRVDRFVAACSEDWWISYAGYELTALTLAVQVADEARKSDDPEGAFEFWRDLPPNEQVASLPGGEEMFGDLSGNQFGYAMRVASILLMGDSSMRTLALRFEHGAMTPLVGCDKYGCRVPTDEEIAEVEARYPDEAKVGVEEVDPS